MRILTRDLADFFSKRKYADTTLLRYTKLVEHFTSYLAKRLNQQEDKVDLSKVITIFDTKNVPITVKPINGKVMDEYFHELFRSQSYCTIINTRYVMVSYFLFLERNYHFKNPMREITFDFKSLKSPTRPSISLSRHEVLKLLNSVVAHSRDLNRDLIIFCILLSTGRRISELVNLKIEHFDFEYNTYKLHKTKSKREFVVPMMSGMGTAIEHYCKQNELAPTSNLIQHADGTPFTRHQVSALFHKYCDLANITRFNIHATRKTFATLLFEEKVDIPFIQHFLDHVRIDTTQDYVLTNHVRNHGLKVKANQEIYRELRNIRK